MTLRVRDLRKQRLADQLARAERSGQKSAVAVAEREQATWKAMTAKWNSGASAKFKAWYDRASVPAEPVVRAALVAAVEDLVPAAPHTVGAWTSFGEVAERLVAIKHEGARHAGRVSAQAAGRQKRSASLADWLVVEPCRVGDLDAVALGLGSWFFDGDLPPYAARTRDTDLTAALTDPDRGPGKGLTVIVGPPKSGKTRSLHQALQHPDLAGRSVWWANTAPGLIPNLLTTLDTQATKGELPEDLIVVIDDLQRLGINPADGLTEPRLRRLTSYATVAATLHESDLTGYAHAVRDHTNENDRAAIGATHGLVELLQAARLDYEPHLDTNEYVTMIQCVTTSPHLLRHADGTPVIPDGADRLAEYLAAVDQLARQASTGKAEGGYRGALIAAALDASYLYLPAASPADLEQLTRWHYQRLAPTRLWSESRYDEALEWATTPIGGPGSPHAILQVSQINDNHGYQLLDALQDHLKPHQGWTPFHLLPLWDLPEHVYAKCRRLYRMFDHGLYLEDEYHEVLVEIEFETARQSRGNASTEWLQCLFATAVCRDLWTPDVYLASTMAKYPESSQPSLLVGMAVDRLCQAVEKDRLAYEGVGLLAHQLIRTRDRLDARITQAFETASLKGPRGTRFYRSATEWCARSPELSDQLRQAMDAEFRVGCCATWQAISNHDNAHIASYADPPDEEQLQLLVDARAWGAIATVAGELLARGLDDMASAWSAAVSDNHLLCHPHLIGLDKTKAGHVQMNGHAWHSHYDGSGDCGCIDARLFGVLALVDSVTGNSNRAVRRAELTNSGLDELGWQTTGHIALAEWVLTRGLDPQERINALRAIHHPRADLGPLQKRMYLDLSASHHQLGEEERARYLQQIAAHCGQFLIPHLHWFPHQRALSRLASLTDEVGA